MADYDDRVGLIEDELPEQLPENLRSVREGHLTHRGATALFRTLRTLGPAATALLLGLVLLAAVTLAAFGGTARWSASAPVLLTDVLDPGPLQYWHCSKEEMNVPMQILDRSKAKRGPWDFDFLEVETGNYKRIVSLPSMEHDGFHGEKLNACAMNNLDEYIYCVLQVRKDKKYELYIVRVGIVDYDTKLAGIHFVARVRPGSIYSAAFDMEGTFYFGPKKLHVIKDLHLAEGKSFLLRSEAMNLMNAPSYKVHKDCQGADYAFWEKEVDGKKLKILWMLRDFKVTALDVTTPGQATCKVWKSDGIPSNTRGHYGAGWTFKKPDGSVAVYFSNNAGRGVYGIDHSRLDLNSDTIHMYKVGESEATSKNDGANCMSMSSVSPFKAEPPKFLAPIEEKPAVEEKTEPEPTKEKTPPPSKEKTPGQDVPQKAAEIPTLSVKDKDDSVVEVSYEWVLMGPKTVCRQTPQDPIIWPANHVDRVLTIAHVCHDPPPCQLLPLSTPLTREDCQKRCMEFENCRGVEYRHSEDRCEILARPTEWFIDNTKHRTVGGPLDFECWLYKPTCDVLIQLRDHGAQSPTFDWAWRVCFGEDDAA